jgi:hypothetical protein
VIVHTKTKKSRQKPDKRLAEDWVALQAKWARVPSFARAGTQATPPTPPAPPPEPARVSKPFDASPALLKQGPTYTGTKVIGIGVRHKSGLEPIFSKEQAEDLAKMRRG